MEVSPPRMLNSWWVRILALTRWREWATSKLPFLISCLLVTQLQAGNRGQQTDAWAMLLLFLQLCVLAAYGFMINSYCDVASDGAAGKPNGFAQLAPCSGQWLLIGCLAAAVSLAGLQFARFPAVLAVVAACYGAATAYSAPPWRLKERGVLGLVAASAAQRLLPVILIFEALGRWTPAAWLLCVLNGLVGLRYILAHQILDYRGDLRSGTETLATATGLRGMRRLGRFVLFPLESLTLLAAVFLLQREIPAMLWFVPCYLVVLIGYVVRLPAPRLRVVDGSTYSPFAGLYNIFMPLYLSVVLAFSGHADRLTALAVPFCIAIWLWPEVREKRLILAGRL